MKGFMKDFLSESQIDSGHVGVGVLIYSTEDYLQFNMNTYATKSEIMDAIDAIPYRYGSTNTADALKTMREVMFTEANGDRPGVENICIIITDGVSNINARRTIPEAQKSHDAGIHIYAIGIGLTDTYEIDGIATPPFEQNRFEINDFSDLRGLEETVFSSVCGSTPGPTSPASKLKTNIGFAAYVDESHMNPSRFFFFNVDYFFNLFSFALLILLAFNSLLPP
jgi:collagen type VI alpha